MVFTRQVVLCQQTVKAQLCRWLLMASVLLVKQNGNCYTERSAYWFLSFNSIQRRKFCINFQIIIHFSAICDETKRSISALSWWQAFMCRISFGFCGYNGERMTLNVNVNFLFSSQHLFNWCHRSSVVSVVIFACCCSRIYYSFGFSLWWYMCGVVA